VNAAVGVSEAGAVARLALPAGQPLDVVGGQAGSPTLAEMRAFLAAREQELPPTPAGARSRDPGGVDP
jgi:hypothetical protein